MEELVAAIGDEACTRRHMAWHVIWHGTSYGTSYGMHASSYASHASHARDSLMPACVTQASTQHMPACSMPA